MNQFIYYSATHTINNPDLSLTLKLIDDWLKEYTQFHYQDYFELSLSVPVTKDQLQQSTKDLDFLFKLYGSHEEVKSTVSDGNQTTHESWDWKIHFHELDNVFKLIHQQKALFIQYNYSLLLNVPFILLDKDKKPLPLQDPNDNQSSSNFFLQLGESNNITVYIFFPFQTDNNVFRTIYGNQLQQSNLPFTLNDRFLRFPKKIDLQTRERRLNMTLEDQLQYIYTNPPRCIQGFKNEPYKRVSEDIIRNGYYHANDPMFKLYCPCGKDNFMMHGYNWVYSKNSEPILISPISLECVHCNAVTDLLDTDIHGYDAELGHGSCTVRGQGEKSVLQCSKKNCAHEVFKVIIAFENPEDLFEEDEFMGKESDLFSGVTIMAICLDCETTTFINFECA